MINDTGVSSLSEDKRLFDEKKFAIITKETVRLMADAGGHTDITDSVAAMIGEDVSYRLREIAMKSCQFMRHAKRRRMTTEDFNKALKHSDTLLIHGHGSMEQTSFRLTRDSDLYFPEDVELNLVNVAIEDQTPKHVGQTSIKAHWLAVEGVSKASNHLASGKISVKKELSPELLKYYENVTTAILGSNQDVMKAALNDLKTNSNIVPLLPYFVNFVSNGVKTVNHDLQQLTRLMYTVNALIHNTNMYLEPQPYLPVLVQAVMYCLLEPLATSLNPRNDHWILRDYVARLQAQIVRRWSSPLNHLRYNTEKSLRENLCDSSKPSCTHYGAIIGLLALGCKQVEEIILPNLHNLVPRLQKIMDDRSVANAVSLADATKVYGALILAAELVIKRRNNDYENESSVKSINPSFISKQSPCDLYKDLYEYFGDSLSMRFPEPKNRQLFKPEVIEPTVKLFETCTKTGEQLLDDFMEQVRKQQQLDRERKIKEEIEKKEREKLQKEKREKERVERIRREEEERRQRLQQERQRQKEEERQKYELQREEERLEMERERDRLQRERERERDRLERERERERDRMEREREREIERMGRERERMDRDRELMEIEKADERQQQVDVEEEIRQEKIRMIEEDIKREFDRRLNEETQNVLFPEMRKRTPRKPKITYPNEDEENDDDFLMEDDVAVAVHNEADSEHSLSGGEGGSGTSSMLWPNSEDVKDSFVEPESMVTLSDPHKGIKLKISKRTGLKLQIKRDKVSPSEDSVPGGDKTLDKHKDSKHKRKRKISQRSPRDHDPFDFDRSNPDYVHKMSFTPSHVYSSPGGESSGSDSQFRKSKLTLTLKVPSKDSMSE